MPHRRRLVDDAGGVAQLGQVEEGILVRSAVRVVEVVNQAEFDIELFPTVRIRLSWPDDIAAYTKADGRGRRKLDVGHATVQKGDGLSLDRGPVGVGPVLQLPDAVVGLQDAPHSGRDGGELRDKILLHGGRALPRNLKHAGEKLALADARLDASAYLVYVSQMPSPRPMGIVSSLAAQLQVGEPWPDRSPTSRPALAAIGETSCLLRPEAP